jgi:hypothetical protein
VVFLRPFFITGKRERKRGWGGAVQASIRAMGVLRAGLLTGWWRSAVEDLAAAAVQGGLMALMAEGAPGALVLGREIGELAS